MGPDNFLPVTLFPATFFPGNLSICPQQLLGEKIDWEKTLREKVWRECLQERFALEKIGGKNLKCVAKILLRVFGST